MNDGTDKFESLRMKARKLAALAARGVEGEREAAQRKLEAFLTRWGLTLDSLEAGERKLCELACVLDPQRPRKDEELLQLALNCLAYVLGRSGEGKGYTVKRVVKTSKRRDRVVSFHVVRAEMDAAEFEDWQACFQHYAPSFADTRARIRQMLRSAVLGFIHAHDIFPPSDDSKAGQPLTKEEQRALIDAMRNAQGSSWERPAGRLTGDTLMLA